MAQFRPNYTTDPGPRFERCVDEAHKLLRRSADAWSKGDSENPPTKAVLEGIIDIFAKEKFLKRPFGAGPT